MKTIDQFVAGGITTLADLQDALQTAMQLEFATIPPYLCAEWSINNDPSNVSSMIQKIVVQEMFHFALTGNMLTAIGGTPSVANAGFIPTYPTNELPGGIPQAHAIDLQPLSSNQLEVFMQIEYPQFPPVALARTATPPATIGAFYDTISAGFTTVNPTINSAAHAVHMGEAVPIIRIADAQAAIARIKGEGEGTSGSPDEPPADGTQFAHYYVIKEIYVGKTLVQTDGKWGFTGSPIQMPTAFAFSQSSVTPDPSLAFNQALSQLLINLQSCWTSGASPDIGAMFALRDLGIGLIQQGIRPEFLWAAPSGG
jgi:Ferritin-like